MTKEKNPACDECNAPTVYGPAIRKNGLVFFLPAPARHHDVMDAMVNAGIAPPIDSSYEQGFMTRYGYKDRALTGVALYGERRFVTSEDIW